MESIYIDRVPYFSYFLLNGVPVASGGTGSGFLKTFKWVNKICQQTLFLLKPVTSDLVYKIQKSALLNIGGRSLNGHCRRICTIISYLENTSLKS